MAASSSSASSIVESPMVSGGSRPRGWCDGYTSSTPPQSASVEAGIAASAAATATTVAHAAAHRLSALPTTMPADTLPYRAASCRPGWGDRLFSMLFPTVQFAIFFPIVLLLSWAVMARARLWKPFIVLASYVFYAAANPEFCLLLAGVTIWNYGAARLVAPRRGRTSGRWIVRGAVAGDLLALGVFKYYSFFAQAIARGLHDAGLGVPFPLLTIALPVGISFFTFQAISYTVDVGRGLIEPASLLDTTIYLSFFPHLVAGPIVRAREFLPQLERPRDPERVAVRSEEHTSELQSQS